MTSGCSLDCLTSVSPICTVVGGMPDSTEVHYNTSSQDSLGLRDTNDTHSSGSG